MRVLIADDNAPVRSALRRLLNEEKDLSVAGEATNLAELMRLVRRLQPDLILLDWELSGLPGSTKFNFQIHSPVTKADKRRNVILASLRLYASQPRILVLSSYPEAETSSLQAGADAFVFKGEPPSHLLKAIHILSETKPDPD